jgi:endo-1,4-beta-mannosidase
MILKNHQLIFVFLLSLLMTATSCQGQGMIDKVTLAHRNLKLNGASYFIKGICYHPVPRGKTKRDFGSLDQDLKLMNEAGINTIRVYEPIAQRSVLDKIHQAGLKVIMGFGYNQEGYYDLQSGSYLDYVKEFKDHNAILFWELGNEYNYHPEWFDGDIGNWYQTLNNAAQAIHSIDSNHPVSTAHGDVPDDQALSAAQDLDLWGLNVYRWDEPESAIEQWKASSDKAFYLSEAGADSYMKIAKHGFAQGENQRAQAVANGRIISKVLRPESESSGIVIFSFADGLWKAGDPSQQDVGGWAPESSGVPYDGTANEEYWGIVDIDRNKKETFALIKVLFHQPDPVQVQSDHHHE